MNKRKNIRKNIKDGLVLEIIVSSQCNLNCSNCDHFSPIADQYFLSEEELLNYLTIIQNSDIFYYLQKIVLIGGEPFLNKNLLNLCIQINKILPNIKIEILTNGLLLKDIPDKDKIEYSKIQNLSINITTYPINFNYQDLLSELKDKNINYNLLSSRLLFGQYLVKNKPTHLQFLHKKFKECTKFNLPVLTLFKNKLYFCPFAYGSQWANLKETYHDYILFDENISINKIELFCQNPKDKCLYCSEESYPCLWHRSRKKIEEYYLTIKDYFLYDYEQYLLLINNKDFIDKIILDPFFSNRIDFDYGAEIQNKILNRCFNSKIDIIIPIYKTSLNMLNNLKKELKNQTFINNCTIYIISDNSPQEELIFDNFFYENDLNCICLKNFNRLGPGEARNTALQFCQGEYIYFLDVDDGFINKNDLEKIYMLSKYNSVDFISFYGIEIKNNTILKNKSAWKKFLIKNSYLKNNNIIFPPLFIDEDGYFIRKLYLYNPKIIETELKIYKYNKNSEIKDSQIHREFQEILNLLIYFYENKNILSKEQRQSIFNIIIQGKSSFENKKCDNKNDFSTLYKICLLCAYKCLIIDKTLLYNIELNNLYDSTKQIITFLNKNLNNDIYFTELENQIISYLKSLNNIGINSSLKQYYKFKI